MSKSYADLERENAKLQEEKQELQRIVLYLKHNNQELENTIESKKEQIRDRNIMLMAFKNRLKKRWWQRVKKDPYAPSLIEQINAMFLESKQK